LVSSASFLPMESSSNTNSLIYRYLGSLPDLILTVGLAFGWYNRWMYYEYHMLLVLGILGLFIFVCSFALYYYFTISRFLVLAYLWHGCLLGIVALMDNPEFAHRSLEHVANLLFISSLLCQLLCECFYRFCRQQSPSCAALEKSNKFTRETQ